MAVNLPKTGPPGLPVRGRAQDEKPIRMTELAHSLLQYLDKQKAKECAVIGLDTSVIADAAVRQCFQFNKIKPDNGITSQQIRKWIESTGNALFKDFSTLSASHESRGRSAPPAVSRRIERKERSAQTTAQRIHFLYNHLPLAELSAQELCYRLAAISDAEGHLLFDEYAKFFAELLPAGFVDTIYASDVPQSGYAAALHAWQHAFAEQQSSADTQINICALYALALWARLCAALSTSQLDFDSVAVLLLPFVSGTVREKAASIFALDDGKNIGGINKAQLRKILIPLLVVAFDIDEDYGRMIAAASGVDTTKAEGADVLAVADSLCEAAFFMSSEAVFAERNTKSNGKEGVSLVVTVDGFVKWLGVTGLATLLEGKQPAPMVAPKSAEQPSRKRDRSWGGDGDDDDEVLHSSLRKRQETDEAVRRAGAHTEVLTSELIAHLEGFHFEHGKAEHRRGSSHSKRSVDRSARPKRSRSRSAPRTAAVDEQKAAVAPSAPVIRQQKPQQQQQPVAAPSTKPKRHSGAGNGAPLPFGAEAPHFSVPGTVFKTASPLVDHVTYVHDAAPPFVSPSFHYIHDHAPHANSHSHTDGKSIPRAPHANIVVHTKENVFQHLARFEWLKKCDLQRAIVPFRAVGQTINKNDFVSAFLKLATTETTVSPTHVHELSSFAEGLFRVLDAEQVGSIDLCVVAATLASVCGGDYINKAKNIFSALDLDNNGKIDLQEVTTYLRTVYSVMQASQPDMWAATVGAAGVSAQQLADVTAREMFTQADIDGDGCITLSEFISYMFRHDFGDSMDLTLALGNVFDLFVYAAPEVLESFSVLADDDGYIARKDFLECLVDNYAAEQGAAAVSRANRLFEALATRVSQQSLLDFMDVAPGLALACAGDVEKKAKIIMELLCDNHGVVREQDVATLVRSAACTAVHLSEESGSVSATFLKDYTDTLLDAVGSSPLKTLNEVKRALRTIISRLNGKPWNALTGKDVSLQALLSLSTNIGGIEVYDRLSEVLREERTVDLQEFVLVVNRVFNCHLSATQLKDAFHGVSPTSPSVSSLELLERFEQLLNVRMLRKIREVFTRYDQNGDGYISKQEMQQGLTSIFATLLAANSSLASEIAIATTEAAFAEADTDRNGKLSEREFVDWVQSGKASAAQQLVLQQQTKADMPVSALREFISYIARQRASLPKVLNVFLAATEGALRQQPIDAALTCKLLLCFVDDEAHIPLAQTAAQALYQVLSAAANPVTAWALLVAVLPYLSAVPEEERIEYMFVLCTDAGVSRISFASLLDAFRSALAVRRCTESDVAEFTDLAELARAAAANSFWDANVDISGSLSFNDFRRLCLAPTTARLLITTSEEPPTTQHTSEQSILNEKQLYSQLKLETADAEPLLRNIQAASVSGKLAIAGLTARSRFIRRVDALMILLKALLPASADQAAVEDASTAVNALFDLYKVKTSDTEPLEDFADAHGLSVALSILCRGMSHTQRANLSFELFDTDNSGDISYNEAVVYITSIITLMAALGRADVNSTQSVREMALETVGDMFKAADVNNDGVLSKEEFFAYFYKLSQPAPINVATFRNITGIATLQPVQLLDLFASYTNSQGLISRAMFVEAVAACRVANNLPGELSAAETQQIDRFLDAFSKPENGGAVDYVEVMTALVAIGGGNKVDKVDAIIERYDQDDSGILAVDDLTAFFLATLRFLACCDQSSLLQCGIASFEELGGDTNLQSLAEKLAQAAAAECQRGDGVDRVAFCRWYLENFAAETEKEEVLMTSAQAAALLHLADTPVQALLTLFAEVADEDGDISEEVYECVLRSLVEEEDDEEDEYIAQIVRSMIFAAFDTNDDGMVSAADLVAGIAILAKGTREEKIRAAFAAMDINIEGRISYHDVCRYLINVFTVLVTCDRSVATTFQRSPVQLAYAAASDLFSELDPRSTGYIDAKAFIASYLERPTAQKHQSAVSRALHLELFSPDDIHEIFDECADGVTDHQRSLSRAAFVRACSLLVKLSAKSLRDVPDTSVIKALADELFDLLDINEDNQVSIPELLAGLFVLKPGEHVSKIITVFDAFDTDGNGTISPEEMEMFLYTVYSVMQRIGVYTARIDPADLAVITATYVFQQLDTEALTIEQFAAWYTETQRAQV